MYSPAPELLAVNSDFLANNAREQILESASRDTCRLTEKTIQETQELASAGLDIEIVDVTDPHAQRWLQRKIGALGLKVLDVVREKTINLSLSPWDIQIFEKKITPDAASELLTTPPATRKWSQLVQESTSAMPLAAFYSPDSATLGGGINSEIFERKGLFSDGSSAKDKRLKQLTKRNENTALKDTVDEIAAYIDYVDTPIDPVSRVLFHEVPDAKAVRTRAVSMTNLVSEHFSTRDPSLNKDLVSLSLGCGAAQPVFEMIADIEENYEGTNFSEIHLVDTHPLTLAAAYSMAESKGIDDRVELHTGNALKISGIEKHTVDVVDLVGLFEYFPRNHAALLLKQVRQLLKPGGTIVFGNMLSSRPDQDFFKNIGKWPDLQQRSITDVLEIIESAGFNPDETKVRLPLDGIYAVYGLTIAQDTDDGLKAAA